MRSQINTARDKPNTKSTEPLSHRGRVLCSGCFMCSCAAAGTTSRTASMCTSCFGKDRQGWPYDEWQIGCLSHHTGQHNCSLPSQLWNFLEQHRFGFHIHRGERKPTSRRSSCYTASGLANNHRPSSGLRKQATSASWHRCSINTSKRKPGADCAAALSSHAAAAGHELPHTSKVALGADPAAACWL